MKRKIATYAGLDVCLSETHVILLKLWRESGDYKPGPRARMVPPRAVPGPGLSAVPPAPTSPGRART